MANRRARGFLSPLSCGLFVPFCSAQLFYSSNLYDIMEHNYLLPSTWNSTILCSEQLIYVGLSNQVLNELPMTIWTELEEDH
jgi:hypothetical protein